MPTDIKVLQVIPKLGYGGAETGCYDLAHFLAENDCKSYIVTSGGELLKFVKKDKVKIFTTRPDTIFGATFWRYQSIIRFAKALMKKKIL